MHVTRMPSESGRCRLAIEVPAAEARALLGDLYPKIAIAHGLRPEKGVSAETTVRREVGGDEIANTASGLLMLRTLPKAEDTVAVDYVAAPTCTYDVPACKGESFYFEAEGPLVPQMELASYDSLPVGTVRRALEERQWNTDEGYLLYWTAEALAERLVGQVPDDAFAQFLAQENQAFDESLLQRGMSREDYLKRQGISENELSQTMLAQARSHLRQMLALDSYARHHGIGASDGDVIAYLNDQTSGQGKAMLRKLKEQGGFRRARLMSLRAKCNRMLVEEGLERGLKTTKA